MKRVSRLLLAASFVGAVSVALVWLVRSERVPVPEELRAVFGIDAGRKEKRAPVDAARETPSEAAARTLARRESGRREAADASARFREWSGRYLGAAGPRERQRLERDGNAFATERRRALRQLMEIDPEAVLHNTVPWAVRRALPPAVVAQLETRVGGIGDFHAIGALPADGADPSSFRAVRREVVLDGRTYEAFVYGRRAILGTREGVAIHGVAIDGRIAVLDSPARLLEPGEPVPAGRIIEATCRYTGRPASPADLAPGVETHAVDLGDRVCFLCDADEAPRLGAEQLALDSGGTTASPEVAPAALNARTTGVKRLLVIRVRFADQNASFEPQTDAAALAQVGEANAFFLENSFGAMSLEPTVTPVYTLPGSAAWYSENDTGGYARNVLDAARAVAASPSTHPGNEGLPAFDRMAYDLEVVRYFGGPGAFSGQAYIGSRGCWLKTDRGGVMAHELGHNLGLWHANSWTPVDADTITGPGVSIEYGDVFDAMGTSSTGRWHFNTFEKNRLDWLPESAVETVSGPGVHRIAAHDLGGALESRLRYALRIRRDGTRDYWLEFRQHPDWAGNRSILNGLGLRWSPWSGSNGGSQLLDTTPFSADERLDGAVTIGRTFHDPVANLFVTPLGRAGTSPDELEVDVRFGTPAGNRAPSVVLAAGALEVAPGGAVTFVATAEDADGDALAFHWDCGDRIPGANAASLTRSWPAPGEYRVRVVVSDRHGGTGSASVVVNVGQAGRSRLAGSVLDLDGDPVADVRVHNGVPITNPDYRGGLSDGDGGFVLTGIPSGTWVPGAARPGWVFVQMGGANVVDMPADFRDADFVGTVVGFKIEGSVRDADGLPVPGALVSDGERIEPTGPDGSFRFVGVGAGTRELSTTCMGYDFAPVSMVVEQADVGGVHIAERTWTVSGEVRNLPEGGTATITDGWRSTTAYVRNSSSGAVHVFSLPGVPAGRWNVRVLHDDLEFAPDPEGTFANPLVVSGDRSGLVFVPAGLRRPVIEGRVTVSGVGRADVVVTGGGVSANTDTRGGFRLEGVGEGQHMLRASADGLEFSPVERAITVGMGDVTGQDFAATPVNAPPVFVSPAAALPPHDRPAIALSAAAVDDGGDERIRYEWSVVGTSPGPVVFTANGAHGAAETVGLFSAPGTYRIRATAFDAQGASAGSDVVINLTPTLARLFIDNVPGVVDVGDTWPFSVRCLDRFGSEMPAPAALSWSVSDGGTIDSAGWFTATGSAGEAIVTARIGGVSASARFEVSTAAGPPQIVVPARASPVIVGAGLESTLAVTAASDLPLTYGWNAVSGSAGSVIFLPNGTGNARETVARFTRAGEYSLRVVVRDSEGQTAESTVDVVVRETIQSWRILHFPAAQLANPALEKSVWGAEADPDGDGVTNLLEYAFELDPLLPSVDGLPWQTFVEVDGQDHLAIAFRRNRSASDIVYVPQVSSDLQSWDDGMIPVSEADARTQTYRDATAAAAHARRFVRVHVVLP